MFTDKDLEKFKALFRKHFKKELSNTEALEKVNALINMIKHAYKPIRKKEYDNLKNEKTDQYNP